MALDGIVIANIISELNSKICGGRGCLTVE